MCAIAVTIVRNNHIQRNMFTGTLYFLEIVGLLWHDAYIFNSVIKWHPDSIGYPACIRTSYFYPQLVLETQLLFETQPLFETRLVLEVLRGYDTGSVYLLTYLLIYFPTNKTELQRKAS